MLPRVRVAALLVPLAVLAALVPGPAQAAPAGGGTQAADVVLYDHCATYPVTYSASVPAAASLYRLHFMVFDPDGFTSEGVVANSASGGGTSGTFQMTFCGSETPGTWTVQTTGIYHLLLPVDLQLPETDSTFTVRRAQTTTALRQQPLRNGRWKVVAAVREEGPDGWFAPNGAHVELQQLVGGQWTALPRTVLTTSSGRSVVRVRLPRRAKLRGVTTEAGNYSGSVSAPITLKRR